MADKAYVVAYDLDQPGQKYSCLNEILESYGTYWHAQGSVWVIATSEDAETVRDKLLECLDSGDNVFVLELGTTGAWAGFPDKVTAWLQGVLDLADR